MDRHAVYREIEAILGVVPSMFKAVPDDSLEMEWQLFRRVQLDEGPIPNKYRELIGLAVAAATHCPFCTFFHAESARLNGATEAEIEDAVHFAKSSMGWSTYVHGMQIDLEHFKAEVRQISDHIRSQMGAIG